MGKNYKTKTKINKCKVKNSKTLHGYFEVMSQAIEVIQKTVDRHKKIITWLLVF